MIRRSSLILALAAVLAACGQKPASTSTSPLVAKGDGGIAITADGLRALIDEQNPMIRPAFRQMDSKKMLVDNLLKGEVLAQAAEKAGLANDPEVQKTMRKVMAARYQQKFFSDPERVKDVISDGAIAKYYAEHPEEFHQPLRVHAAHILVAAEPSGPGRAKKLAAAKKLLQKLLAEEKKNRAAFGIAAHEFSDDSETKATGGDLMYKSREALEKALGEDFAELAFSLGNDETATRIVESPKGFHLLHVYGRAEEMNESLEQAKPEITKALLTEWKPKAYEELVSKLRDEFHVTVDDAVIATVMPTGMAAANPPTVPVAREAPQSEPAASSTSAPVSK